MRIGFLIGADPGFASALAARVAQVVGIESFPLELEGLDLDEAVDADVVVNLLGRSAPYFDSYLLHTAHGGTRIVPHVLRTLAANRFLDLGIARRLGLSVPRAVLLPQKEYGAAIPPSALLNLGFPIPWERHLEEIGGVGWLVPIHATRSTRPMPVISVATLLDAYDQSGCLGVMLQEEIPHERFVRSFVVGRREVLLVPWNRDEGRGRFDADYLEAALEEDLVRISVALAQALGDDFVAIDLAINGARATVVDVQAPPAELELDRMTGFFQSKLVEATSAFCIELARQGRRSIGDGGFANVLSESGGLIAMISGPLTAPSAEIQAPSPLSSPPAVAPSPPSKTPRSTRRKSESNRGGRRAREQG